MRINTLLDEGRIREAVGIANDLKEKINKGQNRADEIDWELIGRVTSYYC